MIGGARSSVGGGGVGGNNGMDLSGYALQSWVDENYLSIAFFSKLFKAYNGSTEVLPNNAEATVDNIKAMFGFWTEQYLSALGQNSGGGGGGSSTLDGLNDVQLGTLAANDVLTYDGTGHWVNTPKATLLSGYATQSWVTGTALSGYATQSWVGQQGFLTSVAFSDLTSHPTTLSGYGITDAKFGTANNDKRPITLGSVTQDVLIAHQSLSGYATESWVTGTALSGYATQSWVGQQGFLTSVAFSDLTSHPTTLSGYGITDAYTKTEADGRYLTISFFRSLFRAYDSASTPNEIIPNSGDTTAITNIKAMFGFWTDQYLSALGQNSSGGGGGGGSSTLAGLNDVQLGTLAANDVLTYDGSGHWVNTPKATLLSGYATQQWVGQQGFLTSVAFSDLTSHPTTLSGYGITDAYFGNVSNDKRPITLGNVTQNVLIAHQSLSGYATETWVEQQGFITSVAFSDLTNHPTTISGYGITDAKFGTAGTDYVPVTLGSTTKNVLTSHQSLAGYATQSWVTNTALVGYFCKIANTLDINFSDGNNKNGVIYINKAIDGGNTTGFWGDYGSVLNISNVAANWQMGVDNNHNFKFRDLWWSGGGYSWQNWRTICFTDSDISGNAATATKLANAITLFGNSFDGSANIGDSTTPATLSYVNSISMRGIITGAMCVELNTLGNLSNYGGYVDFHMDGTANDYSTRIAESKNANTYASSISDGYSNYGVLTMLAKSSGNSSIRAGLEIGGGTYPSYVRIGNGVIVWDDANNALKVCDYNGNSANLYALGGVSALGFSTSAETSSTIIGSLTVNNDLYFANTSNYIKKNSSSLDIASNLQIGITSSVQTVINSGCIIGSGGSVTATSLTMNNYGYFSVQEQTVQMGSVAMPVDKIILYINGTRYYFNKAVAIAAGILTTSNG